MELNYLIYVALFTMLAVLQAWLINGVFTAAAGDTEKRVDGKDIDSEMIFYPLKKELTRTKKVQVFYDLNNFTKLFEQLNEAFPDTRFPIEKFDEPELSFTAESDEDDIRKFYDMMVAKADSDTRIKWEYDGEFAKFHGHLYKEYDVKVYSKWIRKPIIECVKCMASFWSAITYWPLVIWVFSFQVWQLPVFVADMLVVCYLSWLSYKKVS